MTVCHRVSHSPNIAREECDHLRPDFSVLYRMAVVCVRSGVIPVIEHYLEDRKAMVFSFSKLGDPRPVTGSQPLVAWGATACQRTKHVCPKEKGPLTLKPEVPHPVLLPMVISLRPAMPSE